MTGPDTDLAPAHSQEALSVGNCWDCGSKSLASRPRGSPAWPHVPRPSHTRHPQPVPDGASTVWKPSPRLLYTSPRNLKPLQNKAVGSPARPSLHRLLAAQTLARFCRYGGPGGQRQERPHLLRLCWGGLGSLAVIAGGCPRRVSSVSPTQASQALVPLVGPAQRTPSGALAMLFPAWNSQSGGGLASPH